MAMIDQTQVNNLLNGIMRAATVTFPSALWLKLGSTAPTATSNMTELANGNGYTTGGQQLTGSPPWGAASGGVASGPATAVSWQASGSGLSGITGLEIWDAQSSGHRWVFGSWTGAPINVASGNTFEVNVNAITMTATW